jgi:hypothetical protein
MPPDPSATGYCAMAIRAKRIFDNFERPPSENR